ncbi:MAG TPA: hypothetical protein VK798_08030, partial [Alloacidobacterium sp.]|nr:hypothetical protein [Alloacidobacterium sp.]
ADAIAWGARHSYPDKGSAAWYEEWVEVRQRQLGSSIEGQNCRVLLMQSQTMGWSYSHGNGQIFSADALTQRSILYSA